MSFGAHAQHKLQLQSPSTRHTVLQACFLHHTNQYGMHLSADQGVAAKSWSCVLLLELAWSIQPADEAACS